MGKTGYSWMLLYWKIQTYSRPIWNTELTVKTWARKFEKVSSWRDFEVFDNNGDLVLMGTTQWVLIDINKKSIAKITDKMHEEYGIYEKSVFDDEPSGKLQIEDGMERKYDYTPTRRDIDANHHMNNVNYLEIAYDAIPSGSKLDFNNLEIYYKKQTKLGETVSVYYINKDNVHTVCIKGKDDDSLHAILKFYD